LVTSSKTVSSGNVCFQGSREELRDPVLLVQPTSSATGGKNAYFALDALQPGRIIGFIVPGVAAAARKPLLRPHAVGRLVLALRKKPGTRNPEFVGWSVDYDGRFRFEPAPIIEAFADQVSPHSKRKP
jgi:hypothetical protein